MNGGSTIELNKDPNGTNKGIIIEEQGLHTIIQEMKTISHAMGSCKECRVKPIMQCVIEPI